MRHQDGNCRRIIRLLVHKMHRHIFNLDCVLMVSDLEVRTSMHKYVYRSLVYGHLLVVPAVIMHPFVLEILQSIVSWSKGVVASHELFTRR
jgi:hypothetical protein